MILRRRHNCRTAAMVCETCRWTERPGFVRRPEVTAEVAAVAGDAEFIPCPDCGGAAIAHCCEGLCELPDESEAGAE
jgi:hypothetical protein